VTGLVELLCVEGAADAEGEALVDLDVIGEGEDATVVDLGLLRMSVYNLIFTTSEKYD
jgi:hypothetical protein